jgi:hypothetical protein
MIGANLDVPSSKAVGVAEPAQVWRTSTWVICRGRKLSRLVWKHNPRMTLVAESALCPCVFWTQQVASGCVTVSEFCREHELILQLYNIPTGL